MKDDGAKSAKVLWKPVLFALLIFLILLSSFIFPIIAPASSFVLMAVGIFTYRRGDSDSLMRFLGAIAILFGLLMLLLVIWTGIGLLAVKRDVVVTQGMISS